MNLIPIKKFEFQSDLSKKKIEQIFANNLFLNKNLGLSKSKNSQKDFEGAIENGKFKIKRVLKFGYNGFLPIIHGRISSIPNDKSKIEFNVRPQNSILIFSSIWFIFIGSLMVQTLFSKTQSINLFDILFLMAPYLITIVVFNFELKITKEKVDSLLRK